MRVLVIHNDPGPAARPDDLDTVLQARSVAEAARRMGWDARIHPLSEPMELNLDIALLQAWDIVVNLVEEVRAREDLAHEIPMRLELRGVRFTGAPWRALYRANHKLRAKRVLREKGLPTPGLLALHAQRLRAGMRSNRERTS